MCEVQIGIDTFSCYHSLTPQQKSNMLKELKKLPKFQIRQVDYFEDTYEYTSNYFADAGIKLRIFRKKTSVWGLFVTVHPTLLQGDSDRSSLYQPNKNTFKILMKLADQMLKEISIPCRLEKMKLYRVDVTVNLVFVDLSLVESYLRILKKGLILPQYHLEWFRKWEHKAKDYKTANKHSYKQQCKSAAFFAYNKIAQLEMADWLSLSLLDKNILRLEVQLRRKGMKKWVGNNNMDNSFKVLKKLYERALDIFAWYLKRMQLSVGSHIRYEEAVAMISGIKNAKSRERMLYLLRKTSDSRDLTESLKKLKEQYDLSSSQVNRILKKYAKLGISPITIPNQKHIQALPSLLDLLQ